MASLRGYSYDAAPYLPERVMLFELYDTPQSAPPPRKFERTADADTERARAEVCVHEVSKRGIYIGANYAEWFAVGCSLANGFGETGREYYHQISQHYPGYRYDATDKQFTACLRANSKATLGTFFKFCANAGIEWKALMPYTPPQRRSPAPARSARPRWIQDGQTIYGEILTTEPTDSYPAEWDKRDPPGTTPTIRPLAFFDW